MLCNTENYIIVTVLHSSEVLTDTYSASYLVVPTFDILSCDDVLLPKAGSTGAIKF